MSKSPDSDEEEDYMSESFLLSTCPTSKPSSLLFSRQQKLELDKYKRKLANNPKSKRDQREEEETRRQQALAKPLDQQNKGFLLFQKMMTKTVPSPSPSQTTLHQTDNQVESLRQSGQADCPKRLLDMEKIIREQPPIPLSVKSGRQGLGHSCPNKRVRTESALNSSKIDSKLSEAEFQSHRKQKANLAWTEKDLHKCQVACLNLDTEKGLSEPVQSWYWPDSGQTVPQEDEDESDAEPDSVCELSLEERLSSVNEYLRTEYQYCLWCCCRFDNDQDLAANCPGNNRQCHDD